MKKEAKNSNPEYYYNSIWIYPACTDWQLPPQWLPAFIHSVNTGSNQIFSSQTEGKTTIAIDASLVAVLSDLKDIST